MMHSTDFDALIVGGGLVGLALALVLSKSQLKVGLVDKDEWPLPSGDDWDTRIFAISPSSEAFLRQLDAWPQDEARTAAITQMRIYGDRPGSQLEFNAYESHVSRLATILENRSLLEALRGALRAQGVEVLRPAQCAEVQWGQDWAHLSLQDGRVLQAKLVVAADGADSWLRDQAGIGATRKDYGQTAVVANFETTKPHEGTAFQWFRPDGVLALLPLPGDRVSIVWSAQNNLADQLLALAPQALCEEVGKASAGTLGNLSLITAPASFPLRLVRSTRLVATRLALVGDAAHNLHPLAGQGVNLGFADARQLASVLASRGPQQDVGALQLLRRYERARGEDILAMTAVTHGLQRLFNNSITPLSWVRNLGLNLTNRLAPLKALLVRHAL